MVHLTCECRPNHGICGKKLPRNSKAVATDDNGEESEVECVVCIDLADIKCLYCGSAPADG